MKILKLIPNTAKWKKVQFDLKKQIQRYRKQTDGYQWEGDGWFRDGGVGGTNYWV